MSKITIDKDSIDFAPKSNELNFIISGSDEYGLDKSVINAIRRVLLEDIPTVAFETNEKIEEKDIHIETNKTSLHNEMMLLRISHIPLYIDPELPEKSYYFECHVLHENKNPFQFVTTNDINIYAFKEGAEDKEFSRENYQEKSLSQKEKDKIFRPYIFRDTKNYILLTELKNTNSEGTHQEIHFYGSPSIKTGKHNACYQAVSCATYSFVKNEELIQSTLKNKLELDQVTKEDEEIYTKKFMLREADRYFHRDHFNEPNQYHFQLTSLHYYDSKILFQIAIRIIIQKCEDLREDFLSLLQEKESSVSIKKVNENVYHYTLNNQNHTIGNLLQSHISRRSLNSPKALLEMCGYKITHPLEESILLIVSLNTKNKRIIRNTEVHKVQKITEFLREQLEECKTDLKIILKEAEIKFT